MKAFLHVLLFQNGLRVNSPVPPIRQLSASIPTAGTTISITYSLPVVIGAGGDGGHTLTMSGGPVTVLANPAGGGTATLTYNLSRTIAPGETGTLAYVQPISGVEEAVYRVDVDSYSGRTVVNNSTATPPPNLVSATIAAGGTQISLVFSANVQPGASGPGGFTLTMSGGASAMTFASGGGTTTLVYTLGRTITIGENGTLAFVQPSNGIEASAGGADVVSFSGAAVSNGSTAAPVQQTATIAANGLSLAITYSAPVEFGAGGNGGHVLSMSGGASALSAPTGSGTNTLTYALARTVIAGETGTLAYTQPTDGVQGVPAPKPDVASFSGRTVTNGSTQVAPTQVSASINAAGTQLSIVYSQAVAFGAGGNGGQTVTMSGGASALTYASGSGTTTLVYNLARTVNLGETGTLAYVQPGSGVEAVASLADVASFSGRSVTNGSTAGDVTWTGTVPAINFVQGSASTRSLLPYTANFNSSLHRFLLTSGALPAGVSLNPTSGYVYNGTAPDASASGLVVTIADSALADWIARSTAPGVTYATDFSGPTDFVLASTNGGHVFGDNMDPSILALVVKDTTDGLTNGCCLRIDTPANTGANSAAWMYPLNSAWTSNSQSFGSAEFYICFRFKIPASRLTLSNTGSNQKGWKWANFAQYSPTNTVSQSFSNSLAEHVLQDTDQLGLPQAYHRDEFASFPPFHGFAGGQITLQTAIDKGAGFSGGNRYCHYPSGTPACVFWTPDEWVTFKVRMKIVTYNGSAGNEFDVWYARKDATSWEHLFIDRNYSVGNPNSNGGGAAGFTGINGGHFLTYETNRINGAATHHKYDQLIVSTQDIALPAVGA